MPEQPIPSGTIAFLFTDVEGSTKKWQAHGEAMGVAVARHDRILRDAIEAQGGYVFKTVGDAFCAAFVTAQDALRAALESQRGLAHEAWGEVEHIRVRMAVHVGAAEERDSDYFGPAVNRVARLLSAGHGGQVLLSLAAAELLRDSLPEGGGLLDMGEHRLKDLDRPERIYQLLAPELAESFPPLSTLDARPNNLPIELTPFVGRDAELAMVKEILLKPSTRLVTLLGPGGVGKTRIALQAAAETIDSFPAGAFFVTLAETTDPAVALAAVADALDVREVGRQTQQQALIERLRSAQLLLVLDNFEQVLGATPLVSTLLKECSALKIIVTSQIVLRVTGEQEVQIPPLGLPEVRGEFVTAEEAMTSEAVWLFESRAQAVKSDFLITDDNAAAVVEICHKLDGLPLAIELAAARVRMLTPQAMLPRLDNRLKLLTGGGRDRPARQQTLREAIAWSYELLPEDQRTLLARASIFSGGCSFEAAERVAMGGPGEDDAEPEEIDVFDGLSELVEHSLVRQEEIDGEPRFSMLASIREYGSEQLAEAGEEQVFRARHARFFQELAEEANPHLASKDQTEWLRRLEIEHDNFRSALQWAVATTDAELGLRLGRALVRFWRIRGHLTEGKRWMEEALALSGDDIAEMRARALNNLGTIANEIGDYDLAERSYQESLDYWKEVGNPQFEAVVLNNLGQVASTRGNLELARSLYDRCLLILRQVDDKVGVATSTLLLGQVTYREGDLPEARRLFEEALKLRRTLGDSVGAAFAGAALASVISDQGEYDAAVELLERGAAVFREAGTRVELASALGILGEVHQSAGEIELAAQAFREALRIWREVGLQRSMDCLEGVAGIALIHERPQVSVQLLAAATALRAQVGEPLPEPMIAVRDALETKLRSSFAATDFDTHWHMGETLTARQAVELAMAESQPTPEFA